MSEDRFEAHRMPYENTEGNGEIGKFCRKNYKQVF